MPLLRWPFVTATQGDVLLELFKAILDELQKIERRTISASELNEIAATIHEVAEPIKALAR